jgi:mannose-6-phosphate isomerase-like protein (cupin superfamily)
MTKINFGEKLELFDQYWTPKIVGEVNDQYVKVAKAKGSMDWHNHQEEDELFLVLKGMLRLELRDQTVELFPGECFIVPRGVEHRPIATEETHFILVEPKSTVNTGNVPSDQTIDVEDLERI